MSVKFYFTFDWEAESLSHFIHPFDFGLKETFLKKKKKNPSHSLPVFLFCFFWGELLIGLLAFFTYL